MIVNSSERIDAYRSPTGTHLWYTDGANRFPIPVPVFHDGIIYLSRGYRSGPYMALRPGGRGDVTRRTSSGASRPVRRTCRRSCSADGLLFMANDAGVLTAADAKTGERVWQHRTAGVFSASPVAAEGRIYFVSESGETIVMRASRQPVVLSRNDIGDAAWRRWRSRAAGSSFVRIAISWRSARNQPRRSRRVTGVPIVT